MRRRETPSTARDDREARLRAQREQVEAWRLEHGFDLPPAEPWPMGPDGKLDPHYLDPLYED
jgi:hypothetical protein